MSTPTFSHRTLLYDDVEEFLDGAVSFLVEGFEASEPALVAIDRAKGDALRERLPAGTDDLHFVDMAELGRNPGRIISAWADFVGEYAESGRRVRGIGEPIWPGRTDDEIAECHRHEALLNVAFADQAGFSLLCPYDRAQLDDAVLAEAQHTHPESHGGPFDAEALVFQGELAELGEPVELLEIGGGPMSEIRRRVTDIATAAGLDPDRVDDLVLAASEAATNTVQHSGGKGMLRIWNDAPEIVCEVRDPGRLRDPLVGRMPVAYDQLDGRGIWLINQLCDLVQIRSSEKETVVRMHMRC